MPGVIRFSEHGEPQLISDSIGDIKRYYAMHALYGIDKTKESGPVAWY